MDNFDEYFKNLDTINQVEREIKCCEKKENYDLSDKNGIICKVCHNCISNIIDTPEWKNYKDSNVDMNRCGMPTNVMLPQSSLGTMIKYDFKQNMNRVNRYQQWNSMPYKERSLYKVYMNISEKCISADLPKIISETAQSYYCNISETKISRGSNRIGIIAACIYYACKECDVPRSTGELSELFEIENKVLTKGCKNFTEITRMSKDRKRIQSQKSVNLHDFTERFCHKLQVEISQQEGITRLSKLCESLSLINDNTPPAMAAGCIYLYLRCSKAEVDKKLISDICKISEVTVNKCAKKIESNNEIKIFLEQVSFD